MNKKRAVLSAFTLVCFLAFASNLGIEVKAEEIKNSDNGDTIITLKLFGEKYTGSYTGETRGIIPSGTGEFVSEDRKLTCVGEWTKGRLNGEATISYADGTVITGVFSNGVEDGLFRKVTGESSWEDTFYSEGYICGNRCLYENEKQVSRELLVNGMLLNDFKSSAIRLTAQVLKEKSYLDHCIYVEGNVAFVGRDEENCYCRVEDDVLGYVVFHYTDTTGSGSKQAILPNMEKGDRVRIYGFYSSYIDDIVLSDVEGYGYSFPSINPLYGEFIEEFDVGEVSVVTDIEETEENERFETSETDYEQHKQCPYQYYGMSADQIYTVEKSMNKGSQLFVYAHKSDESEENIYILVMDNLKSGVLLRGDQLKICGYYEGQCRINLSRTNSKQTVAVNTLEPADIYTQSYKIYPSIHVTLSEEA